MPRYSILDLCPIVSGQTPSDALRNSLELAQAAESLGYHRYWLAEHHNMPGIASAATAVVIAHVAGGTQSIRVGAGGIMLPNHSPLQVAEQFGTLESLFPGRIDLGLGRAPGSDQLTAFALRRNLSADVNQFPSDVQELLHYFEVAKPDQAVRGRSRRRTACTGLDTWKQSFWCATGGCTRPTLRFCLSFCAGSPGPGNRTLSESI